MTHEKTIRVPGTYLVLHETGEGLAADPCATLSDAVTHAMTNTWGGDPFIAVVVDVRANIESVRSTRRIDLRDVHTDALRAELYARQRCVDCKTEYAGGWTDAGTNRIRCADCTAKRLEAAR